MAIEGLLTEIDLPTLIQLACQDKNDVRLHLRLGDEQVYMFFADGNIVHAQVQIAGKSETQQGEEVVYQTLGWQEGEFTMESGVRSPAVTIDIPWSALLVQGLQRYDEQLVGRQSGSPGKEVHGMADNLKTVLTKLGEQIPGYIASAVVGLDGLTIAGDSVTNLDLEIVNAQMTQLVKLVDTSLEKIQAGDLETGLLTTDHAYLIWRYMEGSEYFLVIAADRGKANVGNLYLISRLYAEKASKSMPS